jgi:tetratricopeptide (TPR) repeat protein
LLAEWDRNLRRAKEAYQRAVAMDKDYLDAWRQLAVTCMKLGLTDESYAAQHQAANLTHTTAGPMLKLSWLHINRTAWKSAQESLNTAAATDPVDPRIAAYRGVIAQAKGNSDDALSWYRVALALDAERRRDDAIDLLTSTYDPNAAALAVELTNRIAALSIKSQRGNEAKPNLLECVAIHEHVPEAERYVPLWRAMLPGEADSSGLMPEAPNLETLAAWSHLYLGKILLAGRQFPDAEKHLTWVAEFEARKPSVLDVGMMIRTPHRLAILELGKSALAQRKYDQAQYWVQRFGRPKQLPAEVEVEFQKLSEQVAAARQLGGFPGGGNDMTLTGQRKRALFQQRQELERRKARHQAVLKNPRSSIAQKRNAETMLTNLDDEIKMIDAELGGTTGNIGGVNDDPLRKPIPGRSANKSADMERLRRQIDLLEKQLASPTLNEPTRRILEQRLAKDRADLARLTDQ